MWPEECSQTSGEHGDEYERRYMDPGERVLFREKVVSRTAFRVSVALALVFVLMGLAALGSAALDGAVAPLAFGVPLAALGALWGVHLEGFRQGKVSVGLDGVVSARGRARRGPMSGIARPAGPA